MQHQLIEQLINMLLNPDLSVNCIYNECSYIHEQLE